MLIDGKGLSKQMDASIIEKVNTLKSDGIDPKLAVILVGHDPASQIYVRNKHRKAKLVGIHSIDKRMPDDTTQEELLAVIHDYNRDASIHGILVQLPLPKQIDESAIIQAILPSKDVDGFSPVNLGRLFANSDEAYPVPCTPRGIMTMLDTYKVPLEGAHAVMVGSSNIVGRPLGAMLLNRNATVTYTHIYTKDMSSITQTADILIVATGVAHLIKGRDIKLGQLLLMLAWTVIRPVIWSVTLILTRP